MMTFLGPAQRPRAVSSRRGRICSAERISPPWLSGALAPGQPCPGGVRHDPLGVSSCGDESPLPRGSAPRCGWCICLWSRCPCAGGLDDTLHSIIDSACEQNIPFVFALNRKALGRSLNKAVPVSVVGIFSYDGAQVSGGCGRARPGVGPCRDVPGRSEAAPLPVSPWGQGSPVCSLLPRTSSTGCSS